MGIRPVWIWCCFEAELAAERGKCRIPHNVVVPGRVDELMTGAAAGLKPNVCIYIAAYSRLLIGAFKAATSLTYTHPCTN